VVRVFETFQAVGSWSVTVFVVASMLNVGLTQSPSRLLDRLNNRAFLVRMLVINFIVVPALMIAATDVITLEPVYATGLLIFSLAAGAPFLIKLAQTSEADIAMGATALLVLMVATVVVLPIALPLVIEGLSVDTGTVVLSLLKQMILPLIVGMLARRLTEAFAAAVQPWIARISNIALYVLIGAIVIGYLPSMTDPELWKAIAVGLVVLLLALFLGWMMGDGHDHLQDVGGLGTAQRGTAAALIVAQDNFEDPRVLVVITLLNTFGVLMLIVAAKVMSSSPTLPSLVPFVTDPPDRRPEKEVKA